MNRWLWPLPVFWRDGKPIGDGIYWPTNRPVDRRATPEPGDKSDKAAVTKSENDPSQFETRRRSGERAAEKRNQANYNRRDHTTSPDKSFRSNYDGHERE